MTFLFNLSKHKRKDIFITILNLNRETIGWIFIISAIIILVLAIIWFLFLGYIIAYLISPL